MTEDFKNEIKNEKVFLLEPLSIPEYESVD